MKQLLILVGILIAFYHTLPAHAEWDRYSGSSFYVSRLTSPRAQALGKITSSLSDDPLIAVTHPAVLCFTGQPGVAFSHSTPLGINWWPEPLALPTYQGWIPTGSRIPNEFAVGITYQRMGYGEHSSTDETGMIIGTYENYEELATVSLAGLLYANTSVGASFSHLRHDFSSRGRKNIAAALGITLSGLHRIPFLLQGGSGQLILGASLINLNSPELDYSGDGSGNELPVILRVGPSVVYSSKSVPVRFGVYSELQTLFNSVERGGWRVGIELWYLDVLAIRVGRYSENLQPSGGWNYDAIQATTLGAGLRIPFEWVFPAFPLDIQFDVIEGDQEAYSGYAKKMLDPYTLYSVSVKLRVK